jgi:hypothetical protein
MDTTKLPQEQIKRLTNQTDAPLRFLKEVPTELQNILLTLRRERYAISQDKMLSGEGMLIKVKKAYGDAQVKLSDLWLQAQGWKNRVEKAIAEVLYSPPADATAQLVELTIHEQRWRRAEKMLKNGMEISGIITEAVNTGDLPMLQTLRQEIPALFKGTTGGDHLLQGYLEELDRAEYPLLSDVQRAARDLEKEMATGIYNLTCSGGYAHNEVQGNDTAFHLIQWDGEVFTVSELINLGPNHTGVVSSGTVLLELTSRPANFVISQAA